MARSFKKTTIFVVGYHHVLLREQLNQEFCFVFENARRPRDKEAQSKAEPGTFYIKTYSKKKKKEKVITLKIESTLLLNQRIINLFLIKM